MRRRRQKWRRRRRRRTGTRTCAMVAARPALFTAARRAGTRTAMTALPSVAGLGWTSPTGVVPCARASQPAAPSASRRGGAPRHAEVSGAKADPNRIGAGGGQGSQAHSVCTRSGRGQAQAAAAVEGGYYDAVSMDGNMIRDVIYDIRPRKLTPKVLIKYIYLFISSAAT